MQRFVQLLIALFLIAGLALDAQARKIPRQKPILYSPPAHEPLPADLMDYARSSLPRASTVADTTYLGAWNFDGAGSPNPMGWSGLDFTYQDEGVMFHVTDAAQLSVVFDLAILEGAQSMWCGTPIRSTPPTCSYAIAGYGNDWLQYLCSDTLACDSVRVSYKIEWATEPGYDKTFVEYDDGGVWTLLPVDSPPPGYYDGYGSATESFAFAVPGGQTTIRFRFDSDGAWSAEDGLAGLQGALVVDSITVECFNSGILTNTYYEDFEGEAVDATSAGIWTGKIPDGFGDFAQLYPGVNVLQDRDACVFNRSYLWGFFDDPAITSYICDRVLPNVGALRDGPDGNGLYLENGVMSPLIPMVGAGDRVLLKYDAYLDNPLEALKFGFWKVRSWVGGCPGPWIDSGFVYFYWSNGWRAQTQSIGGLIDPAASHIQVLLGAIDMCPVWCGVFGHGVCEVHPPLYDNVQVVRVNQVGPEFMVRHYELFQDNFAADGTLTGAARADMAKDIAPGASPTILPGDSICTTLSGVGTDPNTGVGPAAYVYVAVWPPGQLGKTPADLEAPETRAGVGSRFPLVDTIIHGGTTWACFRADTVLTAAGAVVPDRYCFDLNDGVFTPGDTICYVLAADDGAGNTNYWSRRLAGQGVDFVTDDLGEALTSPLEFTILPAGGWLRGGDILYVDDADDRSGPPQLFFDSAMDLLNIRELVDRYDVLGPSSAVGNSLASRVKSVATQVCDCYSGIVWSSGDLSSGTIGDGTGAPEKSDDFALLFQFVDAKANHPGLYISGDNIAEEWASLGGAAAAALRATYMNFILVDGDHIAAGESVSPLLTAIGPNYIELGIPNQLLIYGGCPDMNDFDVLQATGLSSAEFPYPSGAGNAMLIQGTPNSNGSVAWVALSGFSFHNIRDAVPEFPPARVRHLRNTLLAVQVSPIPWPIGIPDALSRDYLSNAAPNPFNPETTIRYGVRERGHVVLKIYNVAGQLVRTLVNEVKTPNEAGFQVAWDGRDDRGSQVSTGVYFYKLTTTGFTQTKKMVLLK